MAVILGSARIDERGNATGGAAGDQTGKEVSTQNWYKHAKGWNVFRAKDPIKAKKIAEAMRKACYNNNIGYDQSQRLTLYEASKQYGFDPANVKTKVECDCSALVRVCCAYAGITTANFRTSTQKGILLGTGEFWQMEGSKYEASSDYLRAGDILCTKTQGHTVVVLTDGAKAASDKNAAPREYSLGDRILRNGDVGEDVRDMQTKLIAIGFDCGIWGADGDFGDQTELAVIAFQNANGCEVDGEFGPESLKAMKKELEKLQEPDRAFYVRICGGNCYVRMQPDKNAGKLGVAMDGMLLPYAGKDSEEGWHAVNYNGWSGWVSGKYSRLEA